MTILIDGPHDGIDIELSPGTVKLVVPFVRENSGREDQVLGLHEYGSDGHFLGECVLTETMNADAWRETVKYLWLDA